MIGGGRDIGLPIQKIEKTEEVERVPTQEDQQETRQNFPGDPRFANTRNMPAKRSMSNKGG